MVWKQRAAELVSLLDGALGRFACEKRKMFGGTAYFVNDNMFVWVHLGDLAMRLSESDQASLLSSWDDAAQFEPRPGQAMREYVVIPPSLYGDAKNLDVWLDRSFTFAASLPPKPSKGKKPA